MSSPTPVPFPSPIVSVPVAAQVPVRAAAHAPPRGAAPACRSCAVTHVGRRESNEDSLLHQPEQGLFVVADGMGGYEGGEVASQIVVDTVGEVYERLRADREATFPWRLEREKSFAENLLLAALRLSNRAIVERRTGRLRDMGSTVVAVCLGIHNAVVAHVGDSRIYRLRGSELTALTRDHSLFEEARAAGLSTMQSKRDCSFANVITRALGIAERAEPDVCTVETQPGDLLLLCSDGLSDPLSEPRIAELLKAARAPGDQALAIATEGLVQAAYDAGGRDNISAIVVQVL